MLKHTIMFALVAGLVLALAPAARAEQYVYEPFDYTDGENLQGKVAQGLDPWTGTGAVIKSAGKSYTDGDGNELVASGNYMEYVSGVSMNIDTTLWPAGYVTDDGLGNADSVKLGAPGATIWSSFIRKANSIPPDPNYWFEDIAIGPRLLIGRYYWQTTLSVIYNQPPADPTTASALDEHFVILRHETNQDGDTVVDMWVDPPLDDETGLPDLNDSPEGDFQSTSVVIAGGHTFDSWNFRNGGGGTRFFDYDEIRMGTSYDDVTNVVDTGPPVLVWRDATEGDWTSINWTPDSGTTWQAPAGGEIMVVNSGISTVSTDTTVLDPSTSLSIARDAAGGTVEIAPAGTLAVGDVDISTGGRLNVNGALSASGITLAASGTLALGDGATLVSPLAAPDLSDVTLTLDGTLEAGGGVATIGDEDNDLSSTNLTLGDGATFDWTFGAGADNYLDVNGEVIFAGGLTIQLADGGGTAGGADVALFRALDASIVDISQVTVLSPAGLGWTWDTDGGGNPLLTFGGEFLVLEGLVTGVAGDTNGDGIVNDTDLANLEAQFGGAPGADSADFDGDGDVDAHDFATMRGNWGFGTAPAPLSGEATPEPATMSLLAIGGLLVLRRRRKEATSS